MKAAFSLLLAAGCLVACGSEGPRSKQAYSVLQSQELELMKSPISGPFVFSQRVFGTEFNTIAFPVEANSSVGRKAKKSHLLIFIANAGDNDPVYSLPTIDQEEFHISPELFSEITRRHMVTGSTKAFLSASVARH